MLHHLGSQDLPARHASTGLNHEWPNANNINQHRPDVEAKAVANPTTIQTEKEAESAADQLPAEDK